MEAGKSVDVVCTLLAIEHTNLFYRACSICERTLSDNPVSGSSSLCHFCNFNSFNPASSSKRLFRVLISIASITQVITVICFDRAARVLFGCSADEFFDFAKLHPLAASAANDILQGEKFKMELSKPKNGNAQNLRVVQVVPLRSDFQPAITTLRELYQIRRMDQSFLNSYGISLIVLLAVDMFKLFIESLILHESLSNSSESLLPWPSANPTSLQNLSFSSILKTQLGGVVNCILHSLWIHEIVGSLAPASFLVSSILVQAETLPKALHIRQTSETIYYDDIRPSLSIYIVHG